MTELTRQQLCAALSISESTVRRLELDGLPYTPVGIRSKRYDLAECKAWLKVNPPQTAKPRSITSTPALRSAAQEFVESSRKVRLRVMPN